MTTDPRSVLSGRRILVVEDERLIALDLQFMLEDWGCAVIGPAGTAEAGLRLARDEAPDAALLDVNLPGGTSEPIAAALRAEGRPYLVLTAYRRSDLSGALLDAPILGKPVDERKLRDRLSSLFQEGSAP